MANDLNVVALVVGLRGRASFVIPMEVWPSVVFPLQSTGERGRLTIDGRMKPTFLTARCLERVPSPSTSIWKRAGRSHHRRTEAESLGTGRTKSKQGRNCRQFFAAPFQSGSTEGRSEKSYGEQNVARNQGSYSPRPSAKPESVPMMDISGPEQFDDDQIPF